MRPIVTKMVLMALLAASFTTQAQTTPEAPNLSATETLVQSMGLAAELKAQVQRIQMLPQHADKTPSRVLALEKKMIDLSEAELGGAIARALDAGLSAADRALITEHHNSSLGKKVALLTEQAQAAAAMNKKVSATAHLAGLMQQTLSPEERKGLEAFAATGATERLVKLLDSKAFDHALARELEALPVSGR